MKRSVKYRVFVASFSLWFILLILVFLPISKLITPTFPLTAEYNYMLIIFLVSAALSSLTSFYMGLDKLRTTPRRLPSEKVFDK